MTRVLTNRKARQRAYTQPVREDVETCLETLRDALKAEPDSPEEHALVFLCTFAEVSLRLMAKSNTSKVLDIVQAVEMRALMDGKKVIG